MKAIIDKPDDFRHGQIVEIIQLLEDDICQVHDGIQLFNVHWQYLDFACSKEAGA